MKPRLILIAAVVILTCFGFLMVYSASSITSLASEALGNDPAYYLKRQLIFAALGTGLAVFIAKSDYHLWGKTLVRIIWILTILLLLAIFLPIAGADAYGATRWIAIGPSRSSRPSSPRSRSSSWRPTSPSATTTSRSWASRSS